MTDNYLYNKGLHYLKLLCTDFSERCVGSPGNRKATAFFEKEMTSLGWKTEASKFDAICWEDGGATLKADGTSFKVFVSPYSRGCSITSDLTSASTISELTESSAKNKIIFLYGELAKEQLMPKNFTFYNPPHHQKIISLLEKSGAKAIICATGRNAALAGGVYPFPLIEDGDFNIPSVYMTQEEGEKLKAFINSRVTLKSVSKRIPSTGYNIKGKKGSNSLNRIVITAHIDAKKGTPGAIDNASGIVVLLLLAELLNDYRGEKQIEIVAFNGEDYYSVPGQMKYIMENRNSFDSIDLNINIDGAGYKEGKSAFSFFDISEEMKEKVNEVINKYPGITEGPMWPQGDHSIFVQFGRPAIAVSSKWFIDNIDAQDITHTTKDNIEIVDCKKLIEIAKAITAFIRKL